MGIARFTVEWSHIANGVTRSFSLTHFKFDDRALRCSYCGRWGAELTCRGCGAPHSPDDDPAVFKFYGKQAALANYSKRSRIDDALQAKDRRFSSLKLLHHLGEDDEEGTVREWLRSNVPFDEWNAESRILWAKYQDAIERSTVPSVIVTHDEYGNEIEYDSLADAMAEDPGDPKDGLINWRL